MATVAEALNQFLATVEPCNPRSTASPASIMKLFGGYLDDYGHEGLNKFDQARFDKEYEAGHRFCDVFEADHVRPYHLTYFVNTFVIRKVMGTKAFLKASGPLMEKFAIWLHQHGHWSDDDSADFRELVGPKAGVDLLQCDAFSQALWEYVERNSVDASDDLPDDGCLDDQFTIKRVETGKLVLEAWLDSNEGEIVLALPQKITAKAKPGWSVTMELARLGGRWRILGVGNVFP